MEATILRPLRVLREATGSGLRVVLIEEGPGNRRDRNMYPGEALRRSAMAFDGVKCFLNHPGASEEEDRPERDVRDVCGWFSGVQSEILDGRTALTADLHFTESAAGREAAALVRSDAKYRQQYPDGVLVGFSINAVGPSHQVERDGDSQPWWEVEEFTKVTSTDLVTFPSRRGRVLETMREAEDLLERHVLRRRLAQACPTKRDVRRGLEALVRFVNDTPSRHMLADIRWALGRLREAGFGDENEQPKLGDKKNARKPWKKDGKDPEWKAADEDEQRGNGQDELRDGEEITPLMDLERRLQDAEETQDPEALETLFQALRIFLAEQVTNARAEGGEDDMDEEKRPEDEKEKPEAPPFPPETPPEEDKPKEETEEAALMPDEQTVEPTDDEYVCEACGHSNRVPRAEAAVAPTAAMMASEAIAGCTREALTCEVNPCPKREVKESEAMESQEAKVPDGISVDERKELLAYRAAARKQARLREAAEAIEKRGVMLRPEELAAFDPQQWAAVLHIAEQTAGPGRLYGPVDRAVTTVLREADRRPASAAELFERLFNEQ